MTIADRYAAERSHCQAVLDGTAQVAMLELMHAGINAHCIADITVDSRLVQ